MYDVVMFNRIEAGVPPEALPPQERLLFWKNKAIEIYTFALENDIPSVFRGSLHAEALKPGFLNDGYKEEKKQWRDLDILIVGAVDKTILSKLTEIARPVTVDFVGNEYIEFDEENEKAFLVYKKIREEVPYEFFIPQLLEVNGVYIPFLDPLVHYHLFETVSFGGITGPRLRDAEKMKLYREADSRFSVADTKEEFSVFTMYRRLRTIKYPLETAINKLRGDIPAPKSKRLRSIFRAVFSSLNSQDKTSDSAESMPLTEETKIPDVIGDAEQFEEVREGGESIVTPIENLVGRFALKAYKDTGSVGGLLARAKDLMDDYAEFASYGLTGSIPHPNLFIAEDIETGKPRLYGLQEWVGGTLLRELSILSVIKNPTLRKELSDLLKKVTHYYELYNMMPDIVGTLGLRVRGRRIPSFENLLPLFSRNIIVDENGKPHLVDTGVRKTKEAQGKIRALLQYEATSAFGHLIHQDNDKKQEGVSTETETKIKEYLLVLKNGDQFAATDEELRDEEKIPFKKVVIVVNSLTEINGVQACVINFLRYLRVNGVETTVLCTAPEDNVYEDEFYGRVVSIGGIKTPYGDRYLSVPRPHKLNKFLNNFNPDAAVLYNPTTLGVETAVLFHELGVPTVATVDTNYSAYIRAEIPGIVGKSASHLVAEVDSFIKRHLPVKKWAIPSVSYKVKLEERGLSNLEVVRRKGNIHISPEIEEHTSKIREMIAPNGELILLYVGKISEVKNLDFLARVSRMLEQRKVNFKLVLVGDNSNNIEKQKVLAGFDPQSTLYLGKQMGDRLGALYKAADLFVFPSQTETLGMVTIEALSAGLPVLGADAVGTRDLIIHGKNGYLVRTTEPGNVLNWVEIVQDLASDRAKLSELKSMTTYPADVCQSWKEYGRSMLKLFA